MSLEFKLKKGLEGFSIDMELKLGAELLVLFGPSGAGKTLLLKMISGIIAPDEGYVNVAGTPVYDSGGGLSVPMRDRKIGYLFQDYALFPHMTVRENIAYGLSGLGQEERASKAGELMAVMRLEGLEKRYPHELSGGQKQRTALARTLAAGPRILLLDEPFSALDYQVREKLRGDLANIHRLYPVTTVLVTHDLEEAFMLGTRIAVVNAGRIEQVGTREDVFYRPRTKNVARFLGARNLFAGLVSSVSGDEAVIESPHLGGIKACVDPHVPLKEGQKVTFCVRPEEVLIIRPDRRLDKVQDNIVEGEITSITGRGTTHILYIRSGSADPSADSTLLKVEVPNFVLRKLALAEGSPIRVSLKKENVWVIP